MRAFLVAVALLWATAAVQAEEWTVENSVQSRFESNDNYRLTPLPAGRVYQLSVAAAFSAARLAENSSTRVDLGLTGYALRGAGGGDHVDGRFGLIQSVADLRDTYSASFEALRDTTFDTELRTTGVVLARGQRNSVRGSGSWVHAYSERTTLQAQLAYSGVGYASQPNAGADYRYVALTGGWTYSYTELDRFDLQVSHTDYRTVDNTTQARTDDAKWSWTRTLSERMTASVGFGGYRTNTSINQTLRVCPLDPLLCSLGLVGYQVIARQGSFVNHGYQYSASWQYLGGEVTSAEVRLARQVTPSGASVVVAADTLSFNATHALAPTVRVGVDVAQTVSRYLGADVASRPRYRTAGIFISQAIAADLSAEAGYRWTRSDELSSGVGARSNVVFMSLKYDWPKVSLAR